MRRGAKSRNLKEGQDFSKTVRQERMFEFARALIADLAERGRTQMYWAVYPEMPSRPRHDCMRDCGISIGSCAGLLDRGSGNAYIRYDAAHKCEGVLLGLHAGLEETRCSLSAGECMLRKRAPRHGCLT